MQKMPVVVYWFLGTETMFLIQVRTGYGIHGEGHALAMLRNLFRKLDELGLVVTQRAARDLADFRKELEQAPEGETLSREQTKKLGDLMVALEQTLYAELLGYSAFVVTPKVLDVNKLMDDVPGLFGAGVFNDLPDIARHDFSEAGKCIAFERPTAAAFHLLRGTESVLRNYYDRMVSGHPIGIQNWATIVTNLRKQSPVTKYAALYNELDNIREHYRNPTQHPEKIYDISEAQDLWPLCVAAVNRMTRVLKD